MAFTKINAAGIGTTETVTLDGLTVINDGSFGGNLTVGGVLTYEDVTNVDSVGLITARNGIVVGSGITLSKDGDIFATGITTVSGNVKVGTGITLSPDGDVSLTKSVARLVRPEPLPVIMPVKNISPSLLKVIPLPTTIPFLAVINPTESTLVTSS